FTNPTHIQDATLEALQQKRDVLGIAQTGTGKTGAFLIPIIDNWLKNGPNSQALVVVPTRELALQVEQEFRNFTRGLKLFSATFIGGTNVGADYKKLRRPVQLIVGTPGRLLDLYKREVLVLETINTLILDEFDRMLDMGFAPDVERITQSMVSRSQTLLFSATLDKKQQPLIDELLHEPVEIKVSSGTSTGDHIEQEIIRTDHGKGKFQSLLELVQNPEHEKVLVFAETKRGVDRLCVQLLQEGVKADQIHGDKSQNFRQKALDKFKRGRIDVLVATDVAARGIDVDDISLVINYQVPNDFETYIHRIGRTGRAGKKGKAITLVD
ncbi:MAG: DEAD/DEAH box helicase, partial [Bacteroidetes bacterium]|nr:DEAD/DEAH box helicase [Bacteroidota bacterium]